MTAAVAAKRREYMHLEITYWGDPDLRQLNLLASEGWRVVAPIVGTMFGAIGAPPVTTTTHLLLERELAELAPASAPG